MGSCTVFCPFVIVMGAVTSSQLAPGIARRPSAKRAARRSVDTRFGLRWGPMG